MDKNCPHCGSELVKPEGDNLYGLVKVIKNAQGPNEIKVDTVLPVNPNICLNCNHVDLELNR